MKERLGTWRMQERLAESFRAYLSHGTPRVFAPGERLYSQGELGTRFYFIVSGIVQVSIFREDGTEIILESMGKDTLCGEGPAIDGLPRFSTAVALVATETVAFDSQSLPALLQADPDFGVDLMRVICLKQRILAVRLEHFASRDPEDRIIELLLRLADMFADDGPEGRTIRTYLTHEQIAALTGTTRVTVTRTLNRLRERGILETEDGYFRIRNTPPGKR
jgi:CRP/FNR family cyclic AMP-dependent transcriptional regulator